MPAHFTGRQANLGALSAAWRRRDVTVPLVMVVSGPGGVGKTALVSRWLADGTEEFPDGQLYVDLGGFSPGQSPSAGEVLGRLLRALGPVGEGELPASVAELASMWRSVTARLRFALMLDNAATAAQVRALLPSAPGSLVVVTSRHRLTGLVAEGAVFHRVGALDGGAAVVLLSRSVGRDRVERERPQAQEVVRLCAFLPLAVCLAGARLAARPEQPITSLVTVLSRELGRLAALGGAALFAGEDTPTMQSVLDESYAALPDEVARLYRCLGVLPVVEFDDALDSCHLVAGRLPAAAELYGRALELREAAGNRRQAALTRMRLGEIATEEGRYEAAVGHLRRAREDLVAERDKYDAARARALLGFALGRSAGGAAWAAGAAELRGALGEFEAAGSEFWQGRVWEMLGLLAGEAGELPAAREYLGRAGAIFDRVSPPDAERVKGRLERPARQPDGFGGAPSS